MGIRVVNVRGMIDPATRAGVVYVGRAWAGWRESLWANPFTVAKHGSAAVAKFREWFLARDNCEALLRELWERTEYGEKPLGCWCVTSTHGDGSECVCHAQVLAALLHERFCTPSPARKESR